METLERIIADHPFFRGLEPEFTNLLVGCAANARFRAGDYIFREGGEANEFYLIRKGKVSLEIFAPQREPIMIETLSEGEILGWSWLIPPYQWKFHGRALQDTIAIVLDGRCLRAKCEQNRDFGYEVFKRFIGIVTQRLESTRFQLLDVYAAK
jgi:signal-transduction protein with cAMP-binding, CBS, and nucleotidyltransferase domain